MVIPHDTMPLDSLSSVPGTHVLCGETRLPCVGWPLLFRYMSQVMACVNTQTHTVLKCKKNQKNWKLCLESIRLFSQVPKGPGMWEKQFGEWCFLTEHISPAKQGCCKGQGTKMVSQVHKEPRNSLLMARFFQCTCTLLSSLMSHRVPPQSTLLREAICFMSLKSKRARQNKSWLRPFLYLKAVFLLHSSFGSSQLHNGKAYGNKTALSIS